MSPAFCVMDRGTWDKRAVLVELAFSPFNGGWHFIVQSAGQNCIDMKKWPHASAC